MSAEFAPLLPSNSTEWERAIEQTSGERWLDLDPDIIRRYKDPDLCPEHLLNFLAFERSVDIWNEDWPVVKKRYVIKQAPKHHRHKGTGWIIPEYLRMIGVTTKKIVTPRQQAWCGVPMTDDDYQQWLARLPQIRVYPNAPTVLRPLAPASFSSTHTRRSFYNGRSFFVRGLPIGHRRRIATLWDRGVETDLSWSEVENRSEDGVATVEQRVTLPETTFSHPAFYNGRTFFGRGYIGKTRIGERVVAFHTLADVTEPKYFATRKTVTPSVDLVSIVPELVTEPSPVPPLAAIPGRAMGRVAFIIPNTWKHTYERLYVNKPERWAGIPGGRPRDFMNRCRFHMPSYTAEVTVDLSFSRAPRRMGRFVGAFFAPVEDRVAPVQKALITSKAARDRIKIFTKAHRTPTVADGIELETLRLGDKIAV